MWFSIPKERGSTATLGSNRKELVDHRRVGRALVYRPLCSREQVSSRFLHQVYDGVVSDMVLNMLNSEKLSAAELDELEAIIETARQSKSRSRKRGK